MSRIVKSRKTAPRTIRPSTTTQETRDERFSPCHPAVRPAARRRRPGVRRHIRKALELGATKQEITAVLQCVSVLGIHTMSLGAPILLEEVAALEHATEPAAL